MPEQTKRELWTELKKLRVLHETTRRLYEEKRTVVSDLRKELEEEQEAHAEAIGVLNKTRHKLQIASDQAIACAKKLGTAGQDARRFAVEAAAAEQSREIAEDCRDALRRQLEQAQEALAVKQSDEKLFTDEYKAYVATAVVLHDAVRPWDVRTEESGDSSERLRQDAILAAQVLRTLTLSALFLRDTIEQIGGALPMGKGNRMVMEIARLCDESNVYLRRDIYGNWLNVDGQEIQITPPAGHQHQGAP
jgi:hypothetical protein